MPRYCTVTIYYMDGRSEEFFGGLHLSDNVLRIWTQHGSAVTIPLVNIRKYETSD